jgi:hydrophobe/amphiphile efflux-3 (HAE3) family protein
MWMLNLLGKTIIKKPWMITIIIILITIGFSIFIPALQMETSMEDFLPDDDVVLANERINELFGADSEIVMIYAENIASKNIVDVNAIKELYELSEEIKEFDNVDDVMSIAGFIEMVCNLEYNKSIPDCSNNEINQAYIDLMTESSTESEVILNNNDPNEEIDYKRFERLSKPKSVDSFDIKNIIINKNETHVSFSIELYELESLDSLLMSKGLKLNVLEYLVSFQNIIGPAELREFKYSIAVHIEPSEELWDIGRGLLGNFNHLINLIREKKLINSFNTDAYLWLQPPGQDMSFPVPLTTVNISFNENDNLITISVTRKELGNYAIAMETASFGMPARLGNITSAVRTFQIPFFNMPYQRYTFNMSWLINKINKVQTRPLLGNIIGNMISKNTGMTWEDVNDMISMLEDQSTDMSSISLLQMETLWNNIDVAPDTGHATNTVFIKPHFFDGMRENVESFLSKDYSLNNGASAALLIVQINGTINTSSLQKISLEIVGKLDEFNEKNNIVSLNATGNSIVEYEINEVSMEANGVIIPMIFVIICLVLFISFKRLSYIALPIVGLSCAIVWLFGTMVIFGMPFIVMEIALIPMLMGLGVDYSVHLFHNYRVERGKGQKPDVAMRRSINDVGIAMVLATITTFIAFLSFLTATMIPMRDFGVLSAIGIAYVFIITLTFQASLRYIIDRRKENNNNFKDSEKKEYGKIMRIIARFVCKHPIKILIVTIIVSFLMVNGALQVETGFEMEDFLPEENPSVQVMDDIFDNFPFSSQEQEYFLIEGDIASVLNLNAVYDTIENLDNDKYVLLNQNGEPKTESIISIINEAVDVNSSIKQRFSLNDKGIPLNDRDAIDLLDYMYEHPSYSYMVQSVLHKNNNDFDATVIKVYTATMNNDDAVSNVMRILYNDLNNDISKDFEGVDVTVTGENSMMHVIMESMTESQILSTTVSIVLAGIVLIIAYRNPILGIIALLPVLVSTLWIIGTMYYIGYSLNVMTIMITSLTIGLGITYAIHAMERFRLVADKTGDVIQAVTETIGHTGGALLISAVTTMLGFGILYFTPMPVEQQFGIITALTILFAFLTSIFILPPVLLFWGRWSKKHRGYIISRGKPEDKI